MQVKINGQTVDFDAAVALMDDDIREALHAEGVEDEQAFVDAYCARHAEKFGGEEFAVH